jgi:hypothetical protein
MRTIIARTLVASALLGTGWAAAKVQLSEPNFELVVDAAGSRPEPSCITGRSVPRHASE